VRMRVGERSARAPGRGGRRRRAIRVEASASGYDLDMRNRVLELRRVVSLGCLDSRS
jgi:hypothetical protein